MTELEYEFEQLKVRQRRAIEYFNTKYVSDAPENQLKAENAYKELKERMDAIWERIGHMTIRLDPEQSEDEWMEQIGKQEEWNPVGIVVNRSVKKVEVKFERPAFWRDPLAAVND
jgi:hypothetical protein